MVDGNLPAASTERTVAENTRPGQSVGRAVGAVDGNGDRRTYRLVAAPFPNDGDVDKFGITATTGQILTKDPLNHEAECSDRRRKSGPEPTKRTAPTPWWCRSGTASTETGTSRIPPASTTTTTPTTPSSTTRSR